MKQFVAIIIALAIAAVGLHAQKTVLSGTLGGLPDGAAVMLGYVENNQLVPGDTIRPNAKGAFRTELQCTRPTLYILRLTDRQGATCHLMVEPKDKIEIDLMYLADKRAFNIVSCKGSQNVELYRKFNDLMLAAESQTAQYMLPMQVESLLRSNKEVLMSAFLVTFFEQNFESYTQLYADIRDALVKKYPNDPFVGHLNDMLRSVLLPGTDAPDIVMEDPYGNTRKLSDLKGQVVLLDFWASWCSPCRRENPNVVRIYHKYHDKGFEIYSVSLDSKREAWLKAIKDDGLVWPNHVSDLNGWTSSGGRTYGIKSVPSTVLIDRQGKIVARNLRGEELERKIAELMNE